MCINVSNRVWTHTEALLCFNKLQNQYLSVEYDSYLNWCKLTGGTYNDSIWIRSSKKTPAERSSVCGGNEDKFISGETALSSVRIHTAWNWIDHHERSSMKPQKKKHSNTTNVMMNCASKEVNSDSKTNNWMLNVETNHKFWRKSEHFLLILLRLGLSLSSSQFSMTSRNRAFLALPFAVPLFARRRHRRSLWLLLYFYFFAFTKRTHNTPHRELEFSFFTFIFSWIIDHYAH